ncbi:MAG: DeoR/GlpR family DNA-binding transcription regulator [Sciscionella sp.]
MDKRTRLAAVLDLLADVDPLSVDHAARRLDVSAATMRRDLDELAAQQLLVRTRGGARSNGVAYDLPVRYKTASKAADKQRIGLAASRLIPARAAVGLTGGTTTTEVARALAERVRSVPEGNDRAGPDLTLVTNAVNIAMEALVRPNIKVVLTGGVARAQSYELVGGLARPALRALSLDVAVLGVGAINTTDGASTDNEEEASINALMAQRAERVMVVADAGKLHQRALARICGLDQIWTLVTDQSATAEALDPFVAAGVAVVRA